MRKERVKDLDIVLKYIRSNTNTQDSKTVHISDIKKATHLDSQYIKSICDKLTSDELIQGSQGNGYIATGKGYNFSYVRNSWTQIFKTILSILTVVATFGLLDKCRTNEDKSFHSNKDSIIQNTNNKIIRDTTIYTDSLAEQKPKNPHSQKSDSSSSLSIKKKQNNSVSKTIEFNGENNGIINNGDNYGTQTVVNDSKKLNSESIKEFFEYVDNEVIRLSLKPKVIGFLTCEECNKDVLAQLKNECLKQGYFIKSMGNEWFLGNTPKGIFISDTVGQYPTITVGVIN